MTAMTPISPERAAALMRDGAVLVDIRERDEHARERIDGARHPRCVDPRPRPSRAAAATRC